ncbi:hypothetical protein CFK39_09865 [Brachybacterium avium]|uniref:Uncharacterized protein n=1 Tax=Brachybacterium avium TaxID=2017485 RepID=A0A220UD58_9MICO|nr:hypothetical protein [Brachybacterium avium]ASK66069.1 hypothetical protein CFK39_09865 [Brachybacterium avium]
MSLESDPLTATWRDQLIELDLPGVGPITACADPLLCAEAPSARADEDDAQELAPRRCRPTTAPEQATVRAALRERSPLLLEHSWLVVPALGPVLPTLAPQGTVLADLGGDRAPCEVRPELTEPPARPSREGVRAGAAVEGGQRGMRPPALSWFRRPVVAGALRRRGGPVALGALVGPRREWFEPAAAAREDLLADHPDQALESALVIAMDQGQSAVLRIGPGGLDVIPTGSDPRVPALEGLDLTVTARPAQCPLQGSDGAGPCRPQGGPWIARAQAAQVDWEARRSQALAVQACGVCFGEALPPEPDQPPVPRLSHRAAVPAIDRLHLRSGAVVRIDPIAPPR